MIFNQSFNRSLSQLCFLSGNWWIIKLLNHSFGSFWYTFLLLGNYLLLLFLLFLYLLNRHLFKLLRTYLLWCLDFNLLFLNVFLLRLNSCNLISFKLFAFFCLNFLLHSFFIDLFNAKRCILWKFLLADQLLFILFYWRQTKESDGQLFLYLPCVRIKLPISSNFSVIKGLIFWIKNAKSPLFARFGE